MLYIILGILIIISILIAIYTYITRRLIFTDREGFFYGHIFLVLAVCLGAVIYFKWQSPPVKNTNNTFTNVHLVVYNGPGYNFGVLGYLYPGQSFKVVGKGNHWAKVASGKKGSYGWVFADDLKAVSGLSAWEQKEREKTLAINDSLVKVNAKGKDISIKKSDYEEARILLKRLHQVHGIKFIDRAHDRAYFDDYLWNRRMSKSQRTDYLEFLSDFLGYIQNNKKKVYVRVINYRTGQLLGYYMPGKGAVVK